MNVQTMFIVGVFIAVGLALALLRLAIGVVSNPPVQHVSVPVEDPVKPHSR